VLQRHNLPIVALRLYVLSGSATDGDKPGLAAVSGELLKAGGAGKWDSRALVERAESLGASLDVLTDRDSTTVSMSVTTHNLDAALDVMAAVALAPRFPAVEFTKLRQREIERVRSAARTDPGWISSMVLFRELYDVPTGTHPYEHYDATAGELEKLSLAHCQQWYRTHFTPKNAVLVLAGDVTAETAKQHAERAFGRWKGEAPARAKFSTPLPPQRRTVYVVDRPDSPQSQIYVAGFGPERNSDDWAALRTANQILGGGVAGRLFLDVREKRSLAYSTGSRVDEVAMGPVPLALSAGTQTAKAPLAVQALLEHLDKITSSPPDDDETAVATRYLADTFLLYLEKIGQVADLTGRLKVYDLPDEYYDEYRRRVRSIEPGAVHGLARRYFDPARMLVVVAGDAKRLAAPLAHFGPVKVIDPDAGFVVSKTLPHDPSAKLETAP
jgi:predicted Zn-dependent peptidase